MDYIEETLREFEKNTDEVEICYPNQEEPIIITFTNKTTPEEKEQIISCFISDIRDKNNITSKCIISYGMSRSGSTLMWNLIKACLPDRIIIKTHNYLPVMEKSVVIGTYRDIRDVTLSMWRVMFKDIPQLNSVMTIYDFHDQKIEKNLDAQIKTLTKFMESDKSHFIKYEELVTNNYKKAFDLLEQVFQMEISNADRRNIYEEFSVESVKKKISNFEKKSFAYFDKETQFHSKHIHEGEYDGYANFMTKELLQYMNRKYKKILITLGYEE